jgi:hypothetical protein
MERLRKIGLWFWEYKERFVLAIMVLILGYRVYFLVYAPEIPAGSRFQHPSTASANPLPLPPRIPDNQQLIPLTPMIRDPLFLYRRPGRRGPSGGSGDPGQDKFELVRILDDGTGKLKAQIFTGASRKIFAEGESFESYTVMGIDADTECVELYSESTASNFELCID